MKFACDSCQTKYTIPDEKVRGKVLKIRCKKCGAVITVKEEAAAAPEPEVEQPPMEERTRVADIGLLEKLRASEGQSTSAAMATAPKAPEPEPPPASPPGHEWYAMIGGQQAGPFGHDDFMANVQSGQINDRTHVWRDGLGNWARAGELDELKEFFAPAEPPPPPPPPAPAPRAPAARPQSAPAASLASFDEDEPATRTGPKPDLSNQELFNDMEPGPGPEAGHEDHGANGFNGHANGAAPSSNLADLVAGDLDQQAAQDDAGAKPVEVAPHADPFAAVPDAPGVKAPVIGEQTRFFMKKAGVTNRNPWWKYAIFIVLMIGLPTVTIYQLGKMGVGGTTYVVDSSGEVKEVAALSFDGIAAASGLGEMLLGKKKASADKIAEVQKKKNPVKKAPKPDEGPDRAAPTANLSEEEKKKLAIAQGVLTTDDPTGHGGPVVRPKEDKPKAVDGSDALSAEVINKVIADNATAFNKCVEEELRKNPGWKGGKVTVSLKIKASGTVSEPAIDKPAVANSTVGECIKTKAKRMVFPRFEGDDQPVEFPLILTNGG